MIDNELRALILLELAEIREVTLRRCGKTTHAGCAERKVLAAVQRIESAIQ